MPDTEEVEATGAVVPVASAVVWDGAVTVAALAVCVAGVDVWPDVAPEAADPVADDV